MMSLNAAAQALQAHTQGSDVNFLAVTTDTRTLQHGALFVALRGTRFDGHDFVKQALDNGAAAAMVDTAASAEKLGVKSDAPLLIVDDTLQALGRLAAHWRRGFQLPLIAVTGSNGKTTVKEMLAAILRAQAGDDSAVLATVGNLNNNIGMPLTLLQLRAQHRYAVIEMGMNHLGEIDYLTHLAQPTIALVNNAHAAHVGELGSLDAIAQAKGEIFAGLGQGGIAILNADDHYAPLWRALNQDRQILEFGLHPEAQISARYELLAQGAQLEICLPSQTVQTRLQVPGLHNVRNALAASAAAFAAGASANAIAQGLAGFSGVRGRLQKRSMLNGAVFIDDSYNANPDSVRAAIDVLSASTGHKILVLGDMGELGAASAQLHHDIGVYARSKGIQALFCLGEMSRHAAAAFGVQGYHFERIQELLADLEHRLNPNVTVLVKGSRFMEMERVVKSFEVAE